MKTSKPAMLALIVVLLLLVGLGSFALGRRSLNEGGSKLISNNQDKISNPFYTSQTATVRGKITKVEGNKLSVVNSNNVKGEIEVNDKLVITKFNSNTKTPSASSSTSLKDIELNKEVYITLELTANKFQAILIQYLPTPSTPSKPSSTPSSTEKFL